jgi:hypothetical protein
VTYLIARQRPDDLPVQLDIDDVIAAYDDFVDQLQNDSLTSGECVEDAAAASHDMNNRYLMV